MTQIADPAVLRNDPENWDGYRWGDDEFTSVTAVLDTAYPKPWLGPWYAKMAGEAYFNERDRFDAILATDGTEAARKFLSGAARRNKTKGAGAGTICHHYIEARTLLGYEHDQWLDQYPVDDDIMPFIETAASFLESKDVGEIVLGEAPVFNETYGYAGTLDMIVRLNGLALRDVKTNKNLGESMPLQLAAYRYAEFVAHADGITKIPLPEVERTEILWIRPKSYKIIRVEAGTEQLAVFLAAKRLAEYSWGAKRPGA